MKRTLRAIMTMMLLAIFGIANVQAQVNSTAQWYGFAEFCFPNQDWKHTFIKFNMQNPSYVQSASVVFPSTFAAAYADGYVWFIVFDDGQPKALCKAPLDNETQTIGAYETVVAEIEPPTSFVLEMSYNPVNGMLYYLDMNNNLKSFSTSNPTQVSTIGTINTNQIIAFAINGEGKAFGIESTTGNLYQISLTDASVLLIGNTGQQAGELAQSMSFDLDTGELFWVRVGNAADMSLILVDPDTAETRFIGHVGNASFYQITGIFMVPENPTHIAEQTTEALTVWPNPVSNILQMDVTKGETISVFDMTGRMVKQERYEGKLDVSNLVPGMYAIKAGGYLVKFVKE